MLSRQLFLTPNNVTANGLAKTKTTVHAMAAITHTISRTSNQRGIFAMMIAMFCFTTGDVIVKYLGDGLPVSQIVFLRGFLTSIIIIGVLYIQKDDARFDLILHPAVMARAILEMGAAYFFLSAIVLMPIANVFAILQTLPLLMTVLAIVFLREKVGWRRWSAIIVGFFGMLLVVKPGTDGYDSASILAITAIICVSFRDLLSRYMPSEIPSFTAAGTIAVSVTIMAFIWGFTEVWRTPSTVDMSIIFAASVVLVGGYVAVTMATRESDVAVVAPFRYTGMPIAILYGVVLFGEWPDLLATFGIVLIVGGGLYVYWRESILKKRIAASDQDITQQ